MEEITTTRRAPFGTNPNVGDAGRATQQRILTAANDAFAELGYARTSVEAITDRAGCSRPTFYQYFSGKEDLHRRLAGRLGAELAMRVDRLAPIGADRAGRDELCHWLIEVGDVHRRYRAVADNFAASLRTDDRMVAGAETLSARYQAALARALIAVDAPIDIGVLARAANTMTYGSFIHANANGVDSEGGTGVDRLAAALADTLHRAFFGPIPGTNLGPRRAGTAHPSTAAPSEPERPSEEPTRRLRGAETRQRLLDATATAFGTLGYDPVRVDDIAKEAGVSHGSFYRYFADKDAAFDEHARAATAEFEPLLDTIASSPEPQAWARAYYEAYDRHRGVLSCIRDARGAGVPGAIEFGHAMTKALGAALSTRSFGDDDADVVGAVALLEYVPTAAYGYSGLSLEGAVDATAVLLGRGLLGHDRPRSTTARTPR